MAFNVGDRVVVNTRGNYPPIDGQTGTVIRINPNAQHRYVIDWHQGYPMCAKDDELTAVDPVPEDAPTPTKDYCLGYADGYGWYPGHYVRQGTTDSYRAGFLHGVEQQHAEAREAARDALTAGA